MENLKRRLRMGVIVNIMPNNMAVTHAFLENS